MSKDFSMIREHFLVALELGDHEKQIHYVQEHFSNQPEICGPLLEMLRDHHSASDFTSANGDGSDNGSFGFSQEASNGFRPPVVERFEIEKKSVRADLEKFMLPSKLNHFVGRSP